MLGAVTPMNPQHAQPQAAADVLPQWAFCGRFLKLECTVVSFMPGFSDVCHVLELVMLWRMTAVLRPLTVALTPCRGSCLWSHLLADGHVASHAAGDLCVVSACTYNFSSRGYTPGSLTF